MKVGCSIHSEHIPAYKEVLFGLPVIEIEDYLYTGFADRDAEELPRVKEALQGYDGEIILNAPYIDLNPGSPERLVIEATRQRFQQAYEFAVALEAKEVISHSTFLPIVYLDFYEEDWISRSIDFWRLYMKIVDPAVTISLVNTFESHPDFLVRIVEAVDRPNFKLTFDLGHYLVYSQVDLDIWLQKFVPHCSTVYVHSNNGKVDTHDEPFKGALRCEDVARVARAVPETARFMAKMSNKGTIAESVAWIRKCLEER